MPKRKLKAVETGSEPVYSPAADTRPQVLMDFADAMRLVADGKRVTRVEWDNQNIWLMLFMMSVPNLSVPLAKYLCIHNANSTVQPLFVSEGDIKGTDWIQID